MYKYLCMLALVLAPSFALANPPLPWSKNSSKQVDQQQTAQLIAQLEAYLNNLTTIKANFLQIAPDGSLAEGVFYLQRPGKMRWEYKPPVPILMVSSGEVFTYYDYELEQVSQIPLDSTLAGFLAQPDIRLNDDAVKITNIEEQDGILRVSIVQRDEETEGALTLEFDYPQLNLRNMLVRDAEQKQTNISLNNAQYGLKLDKRLFIFRDPRILDRR